MVPAGAEPSENKETVRSDIAQNRSKQVRMVEMNHTEQASLAQETMAPYYLHKKEHVSEETALTLLSSDDIMIVQEFCDENPEFCESQELWEALFKVKFPELHPLFEEVSVPFTTDGKTGVSIGETPKHRTPLFWRDSYFDLHNMSPEMTKLVERLVNGDITVDGDVLLFWRENKPLYSAISSICGSFWTVGVVLANLEASRHVVVPSLLIIPGAHDLLPYVFFPHEVLTDSVFFDLIDYDYGPEHIGYIGQNMEMGELVMQEMAMLYAFEGRLGRIWESLVDEHRFGGVLLSFAAAYGYSALFRIVLSPEYQGPASPCTFTPEGVMLEAVLGVNSDVLEVFLGYVTIEENPKETEAYQFTQDKLDDLLYETVRARNPNNKTGRIKNVRLLLEDGRADPNGHGGDIPENAYNGDTVESFEVLELLLEDPRVDPAMRNSYLVDYFSLFNFPEGVKLLLSYKGVDPSAKNNKAIREASREGNIETVLLLLKDKRVNPGDHDSQALVLATNFEHIEVIQLLLKDKRVVVTDEESSQLAMVSARGHDQIVKLLLDDGRADPRYNKSASIWLASRYGRIKVLKLLLEDGRADPAAEEGRALLCSYKDGDTDIVRLLLEDGRVTPPTDNEMLFHYEVEGLTDIVVLLANLGPPKGLSEYERLSRTTLKEIARSRGKKVSVAITKEDLVNLLLSIPHSEGSSLGAEGEIPSGDRSKKGDGLSHAIKELQKQASKKMAKGRMEVLLGLSSARGAKGVA